MSSLNRYNPGNRIVPFSPQMEAIRETADQYTTVLQAQESKIESFTNIQKNCQKQLIDAKKNRTLAENAQQADLQSIRDKISIQNEKILALSKRMNELTIYEKCFKEIISTTYQKNVGPAIFIQNIALEEKRVLAHQIVCQIKEIVDQSCKRRSGDQEFFYYMQGAVNSFNYLLETVIKTRSYAEIVEFRQIVVDQIRTQINEYDAKKEKLEADSLENVIKQNNATLELPFSKEDNAKVVAGIHELIAKHKANS